jgi:HEAT repeat protein
MSKKIGKLIQAYILASVLLVAMSPLEKESWSLTKIQSGGRRQEVESLLAVLRDVEVREHDPERLISAIERVGEARVQAAIPYLIELISFKRSFYWENKDPRIREEEHPVTVLSRYPAAGALFMIGKPSLPALVKVIQGEEIGAVASENALYTVSQIFRDEPLEGVAYLKSAAIRTRMSGAAQKLLYAAHKLEESIQIR